MQQPREALASLSSWYPQFCWSGSSWSPGMSASLGGGHGSWPLLTLDFWCGNLVLERRHSTDEQGIAGKARGIAV